MSAETTLRYVALAYFIGLIVLGLVSAVVDEYRRGHQ